MQKKVAKKQFKSKNKKKKIIFLSVFVLLALSVLAGLSVTVWFPVKNVQISGSEMYSDIELVSALDISDKENLLLLNQESLLAKLQENFPYIKNLTLKKKLPDTAVIKVSDVKNFYSFTKGEETFITDSTLRVLEGEIKTTVTPVLVNCDWNKKGNTIEFENKEYLKTISYLFSEFEAKNIAFNSVSFSSIGDVTVKIDSRFEVELGDKDKIDEKLPRLYAMLNEIEENKQGKIKLSEWSSENRKSYFVEAVIS